MSKQEEPPFKRRDLDTLPTEVAALTQDHYDRLKHALSYYEDVSQLQRETLLEVRQQLWHAQREYHGLFLTNPAPIAVVDDEGTILKCNSAMIQMFRLDDDYDKLPNIKALFDQDHDLKKVCTNMSQSISATDCSLRRADETTFIAEVQVLSMRASDQQEHLLMFRDITHHKYTQERLELFEAVVTQAKDAVHVMRCLGEDKIPTETIYINEAFEQMFGYTSEDLQAQELGKLWGPNADVDQLQTHYVQLHKSGYSRYHETFYHKDGTPLWVDVSTCIIGNHERGCYWLSIMSDASQQKDLIDRMMRIDRILAMGTLAAGIGHEVSNPLTYAKANVEYVRAELEARQYKANKSMAPKVRGEWDEHSQDMISALHDAQQGLERASTILEDLRMFAYRREPTEEVVSLNEVIESACSMVNHELNHRAKLSKALEPELYVRGDRGKLEQIIINLLLNAIQALPEHSSTSNHIQVKLYVQGHESVLEVIDNGVGFSEEIKDHIFEPFFTTKTPGEGTGLGLAIVHNIVNVHGGSIEVSSEPGLTCFRIKLPLDMSAHSAHIEETPVVEQRDDKPSILIIDDEPQILRVLERLLQREYQVTTMELAKEGLALLRRGERFDIVLCDVMMPEMNGVAFYKAIHDELPHVLERLVFISGGAFTPETTHFLEMLEAPLIRKPFQFQELLETLEQIRRSASA